MSLSHCSLPKLTLTLVAVIFVIGGCQRQNENILSEEEVQPVAGPVYGDDKQWGHGLN